MSNFEPYLGKFHEIQPDLVNMIKDNFNAMDVLKMAEEKEFSNLFKLLGQDSD